MKNNTKLIMETWRKFLNEGTEGIDKNGMVQEMNNEDDPSSLPPVRDADLEDLGFTGGGFDPIAQSGPDDFDANVASILELLEDRPGITRRELKNELQYTSEEIDKAFAQFQGE